MSIVCLGWMMQADSLEETTSEGVSSRQWAIWRMEIWKMDIDRTRLSYGRSRTIVGLNEVTEHIARVTLNNGYIPPSWLTTGFKHAPKEPCELRVADLTTVGPVITK